MWFYHDGDCHSERVSGIDRGRGEPTFMEEEGDSVLSVLDGGDGFI